MKYKTTDRFDHVYSFARCKEEANQICDSANETRQTGPNGKFSVGEFYVVDSVYSDLGYTGPAVCGRLVR